MPDIWAAFNLLSYKEIIFRLSLLCRPVSKKEINKMLYVVMIPRTNITPLTGNSAV